MANSNIKPQIIEQLGVSLYAYNYNIQEVDNGYNYEQIILDSYPVYDVVINTIIRNKYPNGEENAIQRKGILDSKNAEFQEYNSFVERVKQEVKDSFKY